MVLTRMNTLRWRHNDHDGVSNHQPHGCLLNRLFRRRSKKTSKLRVTGLCAGNSPGPVNPPHKGPVTRKMLPFDDVIMRWYHTWQNTTVRWGTPNIHQPDYIFITFANVLAPIGMQVCSKTCLATVLIRSIFAREKLHERFSASAVFPVQNRTN